MRLIELIKDWFRPECPRLVMGYKCHENYPGGCETCGRGAEK